VMDLLRIAAPEQHAERLIKADAAASKYPDLAERLLAAGPTRKVYVRFGLPPPGERSALPHIPGRPPGWGGVSVFRAWRTRGGHYVLQTDPHPLPVMVPQLAYQPNREAYLASGDPVEDPPCEPLLRNVTLVPISRGTVIVSRSPSAALEEWNQHRGIDDLEAALDAPAPRLRGISGPHILAEAKLRQRVKGSKARGPERWKRVALTGLEVASLTPGCDPEIVVLYAILCDSQRENEGDDPDHVKRALRFARSLREIGVFELSDERMALLERAIRDHEKGRTSRNPTIGACFDADRLNLWRVGVQPDPRLLSTAAAKDEDLIQWVRDLQRERFSWACVWDDLEEMLPDLPERDGEDEEDEEEILAARISKSRAARWLGPKHR
jgi:uncharacterized protein